MRDEERIARELHARTGPDSRLVGEGVHWRVEATRGERRVVVHCFWYGEMAGLMLGMNPANARSGGRAPHAPRQGAEYLVELFDGAQRGGGGRTQNFDEAAGVVSAWLDVRSRDDIERRWPFINATQRCLRAVASEVEAACGGLVHCAIAPSDTADLTVYGESRSCRVQRYGDDRVWCAFRLGEAQVAFGDITRDHSTAIARWMRGGTLAQLTELGMTAERHAEWLERGEYLRWHWAHTRDRIADPDDVLAELRPLLERLSKSLIATKFYSYSSLNRFCFSASSHYPWVDEGLPMISPTNRDGLYDVSFGDRRTQCSIDKAFEIVETALARCPITPFWGSADDRT